MSIASKFLNWLYKRSPHNAADPNPSATPYDQDANDIPYNKSHPIETFIDQEAFLGSILNFGIQKGIERDANGQLIRFHKRLSIVCGCGHIVSQLQAENEHGKSPKKGLEGICFFCEQELQKMVKKGKITEIEAQRQSSVCSECARMVSGVLCCPKHYVEVSDENGNTVYISKNEHDEQGRKKITQKILMPIALLFTEPVQPQLPEPEDTNEQDN